MPSWCWMRWESTRRRCSGSRLAGRSPRRARRGFRSRAQPHARRRRSAARVAHPRDGAGATARLWRSRGTLRHSAAGFSAASPCWRAAHHGCFFALPPASYRASTVARSSSPTCARLFLTGYVEAFRQGSRGVAQDLRVLMRPWGFELGSIERADIDPPRRCRYHGPAPARPAVRRDDTGRTASAPPRPRALLDPRRRPADARATRRIRAGPTAARASTGCPAGADRNRRTAAALPAHARPGQPLRSRPSMPSRSVRTNQCVETHEPP